MVCLVSGYEVEVGRVLLKICFLARSFAQVGVLMKRERERKKGETERESAIFLSLVAREIHQVKDLCVCAEQSIFLKKTTAACRA